MLNDKLLESIKSDTKIKVSEIFVSLQGEGLRVGHPTLFVRLYGCNKHCTWCDTKYASRNGVFFGKKMTIGEIVEIAKKKSDMGITDIVITGGEPTIQPYPLTLLITELHAKTSLVKTLETNGYCMKEEDGHKLDRYLYNTDILSISPKLSNSYPRRNKETLKEMIGELRFYIENWFTHNIDSERLKRLQLKFVVKNKKDVDEVKKVIQMLDDSVDIYTSNTDSWDKKFSEQKKVRIYLMPMGTTKKEIARRSRWLWKECIKHGFILGDRSHVRLFGRKRGR